VKLVFDLFQEKYGESVGAVIFFLYLVTQHASDLLFLFHAAAML
jgi:hypothetical protein